MIVMTLPASAVHAMADTFTPNVLLALGMAAPVRLTPSAARKLAMDLADVAAVADAQPQPPDIEWMPDPHERDMTADVDENNVIHVVIAD